jgi:hypothetical protein
VQRLPSDRFASGSAINQATRQIGSTIGVAMLVALVGAPSAATAVARFERVWWMVALTALVVSFTGSFLRRPTAVRSTEPAAALATASAH